MANQNLDYYKIFYEVAKQKNITRASEKLFISQPAVTQTIAKLEEALGEKLFVRQNKGLLLTHLGQKVFEQVEQGLFCFDAINNIVLAQKNLVEGTIKVGAGTNIAKEVLPKPIVAFLEQYPAIKFVLVDEHRKLLLDQLATGEVDIAITQKGVVPKNMIYQKLLTENSVFFCHKNFDCSSFLTKEQLVTMPLIVAVSGTTSRTALNKLFEQNGLPLLPKFEVSGHNMILELVKNNLGIGVLPKYLIENDLKSGLLRVVQTELTMENNEYGYTVLRENLSPATREFLTFLNKEIKI